MTRKPLNKKNQTRFESIVAALPKSWDPVHATRAANYARKCLKVEQGIRATPAPATGLTKTQVKKIQSLIAA